MALAIGGMLVVGGATYGIVAATTGRSGILTSADIFCVAQGEAILQALGLPWTPEFASHEVELCVENEEWATAGSPASWDRERAFCEGIADAAILTEAIGESERQQGVEVCLTGHFIDDSTMLPAVEKFRSPVPLPDAGQGFSRLASRSRSRWS